MGPSLENSTKTFAKNQVESPLKLVLPNLYLQIKITIFKDLVATTKTTRIPTTAQSRNNARKVQSIFQNNKID